MCIFEFSPRSFTCTWAVFCSFMRMMECPWILPGFGNDGQEHPEFQARCQDARLKHLEYPDSKAEKPWNPRFFHVRKAGFYKCWRLWTSVSRQYTVTWRFGPKTRMTQDWTGKTSFWGPTCDELQGAVVTCGDTIPKMLEFSTWSQFLSHGHWWLYQVCKDLTHCLVGLLHRADDYAKKTIFPRLASF